MREFVDEAAQKFFTRIECSGELENETLLKDELADSLPFDAIIKVTPTTPKNIAVLVTKEFHCLADILVRDYFKTLGAKVKCVIGNHEILKNFAEKFDLPFYFVSHENKSKADFEKEIADILLQYQL
ncbi:MAG: formyltetrahydrofolate deformylase, partial [Chitinophagaceae bacterium]